MRNITVSVPDDVYRKARIRAAEKDTSVSALVADYLASLSQNDDEFERLAEQQRNIMSEVERFRGADWLNRHEVHDRAVR